MDDHYYSSKENSYFIDVNKRLTLQFLAPHILKKPTKLEQNDRCGALRIAIRDFRTYNEYVSGANKNP
jgi:hypothetical protein